MQNVTIILGCDHMKFNIIKRKASSFKELGRECIELNNIYTLQDLLIAFTKYEKDKMVKQNASPMHKNEISDKAKARKVTFHLYNDNTEDTNKAIKTVLQDFQDGIFRVFINEKEYTDLTMPLSLKEENDIVFIKLVMLAGRLW